MTSFFATFSKYPSHIFLNLSHISFSTSSSSSASAPSGGKAFSSALLASKESVPCSVEVDICLEAAGGTSLRNGRAYDLRNVVRSGREESEGSLDNYQKLGRIYAFTPKKSYQITQRLHDPLSATTTGSIADDADECEFGTNAQDWSLPRDPRCLFLISLFGRNCGKRCLIRWCQCATKYSDECRCKLGRKALVEGRYDLMLEYMRIRTEPTSVLDAPRQRSTHLFRICIARCPRVLHRRSLRCTFRE